MTDITKLKALAEAATAGPWQTEQAYPIVQPAYPARGSICSALIWPDAHYIAAANPAALLELIAELESANARLHEVAVACATAEQERDALKEENNNLRTCSSAVNAAVARENEALRKDAKRYRFLRNQHWPVAYLAVVVNPNVSVKLGHDCPSGDRLDEQVDGAMKREASHD